MMKRDETMLRDPMSGLEPFDAPVRVPNEQRDRRERIATACLQGLLASGHYHLDPTVTALEYADAMIAKLDEEDHHA